MNEEKKNSSIEAAVDQFNDTAKLVANVKLALVHHQNISFGVNFFVVGVHYDIFSGEPFLEVYDQTHKGFSSIPARVAVINKETPFYDELYKAALSYVVPVNDVNV